jgi:hypothetical protein
MRGCEDTRMTNSEEVRRWRIKRMERECREEIPRNGIPVSSANSLPPSEENIFVHS